MTFGVRAMPSLQSAANPSLQLWVHAQLIENIRRLNSYLFFFLKLLLQKLFSFYVK